MTDEQNAAPTPEPERQMSGTAEGLIDFLDWAGRTGELSSNTAAGYKTAVTRVLEIDGEAWTATNVRELDVDRQLDRFTRLRASRYNPTSLRQYGNRVSAAISHYLRYLDDPAKFRAAQAKATRAKTSERVRSATDVSGTGSERVRTADAKSSVGDSRAAVDLVQYPFPLRTGLMAYLSLPRDLRRSEAQRIATFVASLAIDPVAGEDGAEEAENS